MNYNLTNGNEVDITKLKTGIYIRVSTDEQAREGHSLDEQLDRIKAFCDYKKLNIIEVYREDGKSAKDMKGRPEFQRLLKDIYKGKINNICIYKLDRLTRSIKDLEEILVMMEEYKCELCSVTEEINTTNAFGKFFVRMAILIAQLEIEQTKERTIMGLIGTVKQGATIGKKPFGYDRDEKNEDIKLRTRLIINEEEAKVVKKIFNLYLKGWSYYYIAQELISEGNTMRKWREDTIQKIINSRVYCGDIEHRKSIKNKETMLFENVVPPIISKEIFNECQSLIEKNKLSFGSNIEYMFKQKLYCDKCKSMLCVSYNKAKNIRHYVCKKCGNNLNEHKIEEVVLQKLGQLQLFNLALTYNAVMVDNERLTELLNNIEIEAPDERLKEQKDNLRDTVDDIVYSLNKSNGKTKNILWRDMSYEDKKQFVNNTIEAIYIKKIDGTTQQNYKLAVTKVDFKTQNIKKYLELTNKGIIDLVTGNNSLAMINKEEEINSYIERLRKKYKIKVDDLYIRWDEGKSKNKLRELDEFFDKVVFNNEKLFKIIKVNRSNEILKTKFDKERHIFITLEE